MAKDFTPPPTYADPVAVNEVTGKSQFNPIWLRWFLDIAQYISNNSGGSSTVNHQGLQNLQGGTATERYHLSNTQYTSLVYTTGTYSNPSWITSLSYTKITGLGTMATQNVGVTGTFKSADTPQKTITVTNGIITNIA